MSTVATPHSGSRTERTTGALKRLREHRAAHKTYYLGIDGGGSKTQAVITDAEFQIVGEGRSGASNPHRVGFKEAAANIVLATELALKEAGLQLADIAAACAGIAGISHPIHYHTMKDALDDSLALDKLELVTDARAALSWRRQALGLRCRGQARTRRSSGRHRGRRSAWARRAP